MTELELKILRILYKLKNKCTIEEMIALLDNKYDKDEIHGSAINLHSNYNSEYITIYLNGPSYIITSQGKAYYRNWLDTRPSKIKNVFNTMIQSRLTTAIITSIGTLIGVYLYNQVFK